ncbi:MAG: RNA 2',3'-cyclic phosphodiesterase [Candidatus Komeilibacteria bacterium]|nr:RNA 2',3'-cyclic phosphodiesterase [Candidatus Komeilibacteria bacterium]
MQHFRLFIALEIPPEQARSLTASFTSLPLEHPLYRISPAVQFHITLKFLGDIDILLIPQCITALENACEGLKPISIELTRGDLRPHGRPRTAIIGVRPVEALQGLFMRVDNALAEEGIAHHERRAFHPHITIARCTAAPSENDIRALQAWTIPERALYADTVTLFQSELKPNGAVYTALNRILL